VRVNDLCFRSAVELARAVRTREVSCTEVMTAHLARIERLNPRLNAIVTLDAERGLAAARRADAHPPSEPGPLHGLPIAHKDLVQTKGMRTTFGSPLQRDFVPDVDDLLVERIRAAGAILIGKTNTPELGAGSQTFNTIFGATRNPYALDRTCGGSSGGAAVALAARLLPIADGSDLGGSLRNPAAFCNVVGFRATPGRVPAWPLRNPWHDMSVTGAMGRNVDDAGLLFSTMAGPDPRVPIALDTPGHVFAVPPRVALQGLRVAFTRDFGGLPVERAIREQLDAIAGLLAQHGAVVEEATPDLRDAPQVFHVYRAAAMREKLGTLPPQQRAQLKDTVRWNLEAGERLTNADLDRASAARARIFEGVRLFFTRFDVVLGPTTQVLPFDIDVPWVKEIEGVVLESYIDWMRSCSSITVTGCPAISIPAGFSAKGLPIGMQLVAAAREDAKLLGIARAIEAVTGYAARAPNLD
jgi:amidase